MHLTPKASQNRTVPRRGVFLGGVLFGKIVAIFLPLDSVVDSLHLYICSSLCRKFSSSPFIATIHHHHLSLPFIIITIISSKSVITTSILKGKKALDQTTSLTNSKMLAENFDLDPSLDADRIWHQIVRQMAINQERGATRIQRCLQRESQ